ncbi:MAG: S8 family serine peptidase [Pseudomonadota bacterium]
MPSRSAASRQSPLPCLAAALLAFIALGTAACLTTPAFAATRDDSSDRIIVKWRTPRTDAQIEELAQSSGQSLRRLRAIGGGMQLLALDRTRTPAEMTALLASLRRNPQVEFAEPDRRVRAHTYTPNDPLFVGQWYLQGTQVSATHASDAWDISRGAASPATATVVIAVIDTGVRFDHPDLRRAAQGGKLLPGYDFISGDKAGVFSTANDGDGWDADPSDPGDFLSAQDLSSDLYKGKKCGGGTNSEQPTLSSWHGTRVSGLIAADSDNLNGITGGAFHLRVLPVRALGKCGGYDSDVLSAMYWAAGMSIPPPLLSGSPPANPTPAQIINMSLGSAGACDAKYVEAVRDITAHGTLIVVSAGNEGGPVDSPANCPGALAVAGVRHAGTKVGYSNLGPEVAIAAPAGNCVNVAAGAPCLFTLDTTTDSGTTVPVGPTYTDMLHPNVGTSFSSPLVAAAAGLMRAVNSHLTPTLLTARLRSSAAPFATLSDTTPQPPACHTPAGTSDVQSLECICNTAVCGSGMLNMASALVAAQRPAAIATYTGTIGVGRTLTLTGSDSGAAQGRGPLSFAWSVLGVTGGATSPALATPGAATTTVESPVSGSYTVRLTVTDAFAAVDSADVTIAAVNSGGSSSTSPPATPVAAPATSSGGGGSVDETTLLLLALAALALTTRRRRTT